MASFVPPQVDHNLYTPILPQDNVMQIFSLLDQKQQFYNQGVKAAQTKISSMLSLEKDVTSEPVKNMVTDFNTKANDLIKQYSNLDFSLQGNVQLIDNIYDPLLDNEIFLNDYTATKNYNTQAQRALSYKDSTDEKTRNLFNQKNLDILDIKRQDLAGAKTEKDIKVYSSRLANTSYTPYYDYNAELMSYMKDNKDMFEMVRDERAPGGIIISRKNGPQRYESIKSFVDNFLSDKARNQIEIEENVNFANALRTSGVTKEQFLNQTITNSKESLEQETLQKQKEVNEVSDLLKSYPKTNLNTKQQAEVNQLTEMLQKRTDLLNRSQEVLSNFNNFMQKASNGEVELSRYYDVAENLVVTDSMEKKINNLAYGLVGPESITIASDVAYWNGVEESRLMKDLLHKISDDSIKNQLEAKRLLLDATKEGLVYDETTGQFIPSSGGIFDEFFGASTSPEGVVTDVNVGEVNNTLSELEAKQATNTLDSSLKVVEAYAMSENTPLNNDELTILRKVLSDNAMNTPGMGILNKYKNDKATMDVIMKSGIYNGLGTGTLGTSLQNIVSLAEHYVKNTSADQSKNKAGLYKNLKETLDKHAVESVLVDVEKKVLQDASKKTIQEFEQKYPEYKGLVYFDDVDYSQGFTPSFIQPKAPKPTYKIQINKAKEKEAIEKLAPASYYTATSSMPGAAAVYPADYDSIDALGKFDDFLKTQKGALGNVGAYMQKTIASNQGTFNWLKQNKNLYLNNPENYEVTPEQYEGSNYQKDGSTRMASATTELEVLNDIQNTFLQSIGDSRFNLPNKNIMIEGNKVIQRAGETIIYPNLKYLKFIYGLINKEGEDTKLEREGITDISAFDGMLAAVAKYGIKIKTPGQTNKSAFNLQAYVGAGNIIPFLKTNAGSTADFKIGKSSDGIGYSIEGMFKDEDDFFIQNNLNYKIDESTFSLKPSSDSPSFSYFKYDLPAGQLDEQLLYNTNSIIDNQLYFNQKRQDNTFVTNLIKYLQTRNRSLDQINGQLIIDYINSL
jgi:hypothetical protein